MGLSINLKFENPITMKNIHFRLILSALLLVAATPAAFAQTVFFSDQFTNSTLNSASPANPTTTNTAYEMVASKAWTPTPTMTANDYKMGIPATTSGYFEAEALFATNQVALTQPGDFIELTVVFTNTSGLLTVAGQLGFGLYNSGQVKPIASGLGMAITQSAIHTPVALKTGRAMWVRSILAGLLPESIPDRCRRATNNNLTRIWISSGSNSSSLCRPDNG